jgi:nicotinate phosphoribosyltransferase
MNPDGALLTDLYQLTMLDAYRHRDMHGVAVFELFVRKLPEGRNFLMTAGLEQALQYLEHLRFSPEDLDWVARSGKFSPGFAEYLADLKFTGAVHAMPEGTVFFPNEPILRVTAPLPEAQLVESRLINLMHFETLVASKAARSVLAAPGKLLVDFGFRRAHGAEAGILAARASYIVGFSGTATVAAAARMGIPVFGTMAHSFVQAHEDEAAAFEHFASVYPQGTTLLIDTYDTEHAARIVVALAARLKAAGIRVGGVRLDSGDLAALSRSVRHILDEGGLADATIFASGNLDEYRVLDLVAAECPIDGFGIGTSLVTSADAPFLDAVYKLQEYAGKARRKRSTGKATWPGRKQVYRHYDRRGRFDHDVVTVEDDRSPGGEPLLAPAMRNGSRLHQPETLVTTRGRASTQLARLPQPLRSLEVADIPYRVEIAPALRSLTEQVDHAAGEIPALLRQR